MKRTDVFIYGLMLLLFVSACTERIDITGTKRQIVINASMPESGSATRAGLEQSEGSLDLTARWKEDDRINLFIVQDAKSYTISPAPIRNISNNGKKCSFTFELPSDVSPYWPYEIYGLCDVEGYPSEDKVPVDENGKPLYEITVLANSQLKRIHWNQWTKGFAPVWFHATGGPSDIYANLRHLGTYEILHVKNTAPEIMFKHDGFEVEIPWYKSSERTPLTDNYDPTKFVEEPGDDVSSESAYIGNGQTGNILSWYIPTGAIIKEAKLLATINGKRVVSSNSMSSNVIIQRGHAYHMYATWDGKELKFDKGDVTPESTIEVDQESIVFADYTIGVSNYGTKSIVIRNVGEEPQEVKVKIEGYGTWGGSFELLDAELGDEYITVVIPPNDRKRVSLRFRPEEAGTYIGNIIITSDNIPNWKVTVPIQGKAIEEDKSFHLSESSIEVYHHDWRVVDIKNGSGEYDVTNYNPDIVDWDINGLHTAHARMKADATTGGKAKDDWWYITGKKLGSATLKIKDKQTGEELTLSVKVVQAPSLKLEKYNVELEVGDTENIDFVSGSLWYEISSSSPSVASAERHRGVTGGGGRDEEIGSTPYDYITIKGLASGTSTVTVKDMSSGEIAEIKVKVNGGSIVSYKSCPDNNHPHLIDLGLPSGTKWACCNVGATQPEEIGKFYAWGETKAYGEEYPENKRNYAFSGSYIKTGFYPETYIFGNEDMNQHYHYVGGFTKYNDEDGKTVLNPEDDVAHLLLGGSWHTPTINEWQELFDNCSFEKVDGGSKVTSKMPGYSEASIFLPITGNRYESSYKNSSYGFYWASTRINTNSQYQANSFQISRNSSPCIYANYRFDGHVIRPVAKSENKPAHESGGNPSDGDGNGPSGGPAPDADNQGDL